MSQGAAIANVAAAERTSPLERAGRVALSALWSLVLPTLVAGFVSRHLVPMPGEVAGSSLEPLAHWCNEHRLFFGVGLFAFFSWVGITWHRRLIAGGPSSFQDMTRPVSRAALARWIGLIAVAASLALLFRAVIGTYEVDSTSMLPSLGPGDLVLASKVAYGVRVPATERTLGSHIPSRGDVIVFRNPLDHGPERLVKRVVGLPGDRIEMEGNRPIINGWKVPFCDAGRYVWHRHGGTLHARLVVEFLEDRAYLSTYGLNPPAFPNAYEVKPGEAFVLGDSRTTSVDSRAWNEGEGAGLPLAMIEGRVSRFLATARADHRLELSQTLRPIDVSIALDGLDTRTLEEGIRKCLDRRPSDTRPPPGRPTVDTLSKGASRGI